MTKNILLMETNFTYTKDIDHLKRFKAVDLKCSISNAQCDVTSLNNEIKKNSIGKTIY